MDDLRQHFADKGVAKNYWPEALEILDELPRTPSGKIQKFKRREEVATKNDS